MCIRLFGLLLFIAKMKRKYIQGRSKGGDSGAAARNGVVRGAQIWPKYHRLHPPPLTKGEKGGAILRDEGAIFGLKSEKKILGSEIFFWGAPILTSAHTIKTAGYGPEYI